ncbi:TPA: hypothetical protein HA239_03165 [Candidatus Woesearchaeota archaeon]|nr:hypothetical protein QT06_C0001G0083 [archaeon GW2011_AR15]MBS3104110.1 hypothetical protein [Candidatus Woesearchaeota archaeon]HIH41390.1 hypothetical protein [Candidatus Woesearchaeota archaeon]
MALKQRIEIIRSIYKHKEALPITILAGSLMAFVLFYFTYFEQIYWSMGKLYAYAQVIIQILLSALFGINIALLWFKLKFAASANSGKEIGSITIASVISIIVSGCPVCGITLAYYLGIASIFASFPLYGLELKIIGLLLLLYSTNLLAKDLYSCKI